MFSFIVTDDSMVDGNSDPIKEAGISSHMGQMYVICHPDLVNKVKEGMELSMGITLEVYSKDEWRKYQEEENKRVVCESERKEITADDSGENI